MLTILKRLLAMQIKIEYKQRFYMGIYIGTYMLVPLFAPYNSKVYLVPTYYTGEVDAIFS